MSRRGSRFGDFLPNERQTNDDNYDNRNSSSGRGGYPRNRNQYNDYGSKNYGNNQYNRYGGNQNENVPHNNNQYNNRGGRGDYQGHQRQDEEKSPTTSPPQREKEFPPLQDTR